MNIKTLNSSKKEKISEIGITFILVNPKQEILMQQRDRGPEGIDILYPDMWCFPGGSVKSDEEALTTVLREVEEETSIELSQRELDELTQYKHDGINDHVFIGRVSNEQFDSFEFGGEGTKMNWKTLKEIKKVPLAFGQKEIIPHLETYISDQ